MKLLLDTHTLLWAIGKTSALSERVKCEIKDTGNRILVSAVSLWEIALKHSLGKLTVGFDIQKIPEYCERMAFELIPLDPIEALQSLRLPHKTNHKDPFDRMLIYQCVANGYTLASRDNRIEQYREDGLKFIW
jgi:PIN domain nuclease of toxin-antitoxin system